MSDNKLVLHTIDPEHFLRDLNDDKITALLDDGWEIVADLSLRDDQKDEHRFGLVLQRPSPGPAVPKWVLFALAVMTCAQLLLLGLAIGVTFGG